MPETLNGGKLTALETGFVERVGRKLRNTFDVWFGPDLPMAPSAPAGTPPLLGYLADTINFIVTRHFGFTDIEFVWEQDRTLNALEQAKIDDIYVRAGVLSIDEVRESLGKHPIGMCNAVITTTGYVPLEDKGSAPSSGSPEGLQTDETRVAQPPTAVSGSFLE